MLIKSVSNKINLLTLLIFFSFLARIIQVYFIRDLSFENEWNILVNNLIKYKSYAYYNFNEQPIPSVYMPPLYAFFIYFIKIITTSNGTGLLYTIILIQVLLSTYSVYLFYQLNGNFFSKKISLINSSIYSLIPLNLYACGQISSITLQVFLSLLFLNLLFSLIKEQTKKNVIFFSFTSSLLILIRGEFTLIFIFIIFFIFIKKKIKAKDIIKILLIISLIISPYIVRNYIHFNQIFIVKSLGYNLWKGNNELSKVEGHAESFEKEEHKNIKLKIDNLEKDKFYELNRDKVLLNEAINNLKGNPTKYILQYIKKFLSFYFIDLQSTYPLYYNFFHIIPIILISILSLTGLPVIFKDSKLEGKFLLLYLATNLAIFSIFSILPRYKLIIIPIQIILASYSIIYLLKKIKKVKWKKI
jgi:4-amino-4-deoxy-L-arabinose transferase-like glycosyltransferase